MTTTTVAVPASPAARQASAKQSATQGIALDPNAFLKLLLAELEYQDPTKPLDTTQLVQQLAAMSQVQQTAQTNSKLASILDQLSVSQASSLIGRTVISADGTQQGTVDAIRVTAEGAVARLSNGAELLLSQGVTVRA